MIGRLRGTLLEKRPPSLLVECGGVGYEVEAPMTTVWALPEPGAEVVLLTHMVVREDAQLLYAFATAAERQMFRDLLKVSGIGAKVALTILSGIDARGLAACIHQGDTTRLTALPGIGKKTAERLLVELRDRADGWDSGIPQPAAVAGPSVPDDGLADAVSGLVALGYKPQEASRLVNGVDTAGRRSEDIIRDVLKKLAR